MVQEGKGGGKTLVVKFPPVIRGSQALVLKKGA